MAESNIPVIGIDLGTTFSVVGVWQNGQVEIIRNEQSKRLTPSCVGFVEKKRLVGDEAKYMEPVHVENTVTNVKKLMGKTYSQVENYQTAFEIQEHNNQPLIEVESKELLPVEEVCAMILIKLKQIADAYLTPHKVSQAVISVPAHFNNAQRQATLDAAKIAGLEVLRLVNEPTAAAIAFGVSKQIKGTRKVLLYDLGGGCLDVSLIQIKNGADYQVLATAGSSQVGGDDFTNCLVSFLAQKFQEETGKDLRENSRALARLKIAAEKAKLALSVSTDARVDVEALYGGQDFHAIVTRKDFENASTEPLSKVLKPVEDLESAMKVLNVDDVVLVGGSVRLPMVQRKLKEYFPQQTLNLSVNQDEAVAYGAAILAAHLKKMIHLKIKDIIPFNIGWEGKGSQMCNVTKKFMHIPLEKQADIPKNTKILTMYEGSSLHCKSNDVLGLFSVPCTRATFAVDESGIFSLRSNDNQQVISNNNKRFKEDELKLFKDRTEKLLNAEKEEENRLASRNELESYAYQLKKALKSKNLSNYVEKRITDKINETINWIDENQAESKETYTRKKNELDSLIEKEKTNEVSRLKYFQYLMSFANLVKIKLENTQLSKIAKEHAGLEISEAINWLVDHQMESEETYTQKKKELERLDERIKEEKPSKDTEMETEERKEAMAVPIQIDASASSQDSIVKENQPHEEKGENVPEEPKTESEADALEQAIEDVKEKKVKCNKQDAPEEKMEIENEAENEVNNSYTENDFATEETEEVAEPLSTRNERECKQQDEDFENKRVLAHDIDQINAKDLEEPEKNVDKPAAKLQEEIASTRAPDTSTDSAVEQKRGDATEKASRNPIYIQKAYSSATEKRGDGQKVTTLISGMEKRSTDAKESPSTNSAMFPVSVKDIAAKFNKQAKPAKTVKHRPIHQSNIVIEDK